jgi:hypothetical protein
LSAQAEQLQQSVAFFLIDGATSAAAGTPGATPLRTAQPRAASQPMAAGHQATAGDGEFNQENFQKF